MSGRAWTAWDRGIGWEIHDQNGLPVNTEFRETFKEEDARLIAAAPDLLAALKGVAKHYHIGHGGFPIANCGSCAPILAAIAKAGGK